MKSAQRVTIQRDLRATMPDGVELSCDLYRPDSRTALPTLLRRTPYDRGEGTGGAALDIGRLTELGYNVVVQDVRGRNGSGGRFTPFAREAADGVETLRWIAAQPWSDGSIAMFGRSYDGLAQWHAAGSTETGLQALAPHVTATDLYRSWGYPGGAFQLGFILHWALCDLLGTEGVGVAELLDDIERVYREPSTTLRLFDQVAPYVRDWIEHPLLDHYWRAQTPTSFESATLIITGWYDIFLDGHCTTTSRRWPNPRSATINSSSDRGRTASPVGSSRSAATAGAPPRPASTSPGCTNAFTRSSWEAGARLVRPFSYS